jgi:hypothetical protein
MTPRLIRGVALAAWTLCCTSWSCSPSPGTRRLHETRYANGQLKVQGYEVKADTALDVWSRFGLWTEWHANGVIQSQSVWSLADPLGVISLQDGFSLSRHPNGRMESVGCYQIGRDEAQNRISSRVGPWQFWNAEGVLDPERSGTYADGVKVDKP